MGAAVKWNAENVVECLLYGTRLSEESCRKYAASNPEACARCPKMQTHPPSPEGCSKEGCDKPHYAGGLCRAHHHRSRFQSPGRPAENKSCAIDGCGEKHYGKGYCKKHYFRMSYRAKKETDENSVVVTFCAGDLDLLQRLRQQAEANGNSVPEEIKIYVAACLDYYGEN